MSASRALYPSEKLAEMMSRDLSAVTLCAVMIDGIHVGEYLVLVALGMRIPRGPTPCSNPTRRCGPT
jgi:hypothetical protein